jgi:hypothetical protein
MSFHQCSIGTILAAGEFSLMMLRLALFLSVACGIATATDPLSSQIFPVEPGMSVPESTQQALTKAIQSAILPKNFPKLDPHAKNLFGRNAFSPNMLAMQMAPRTPALCSIPLVEVPIPKSSRAVIGRVPPQEEFDAMPRAEMPAPPCRNWNSRHK